MAALSMASDKESLNLWTMSELKRALASVNMPVAGAKQILIDRLYDSLPNKTTQELETTVLRHRGKQDIKNEEELLKKQSDVRLFEEDVPTLALMLNLVVLVCLFLVFLGVLYVYVSRFPDLSSTDRITLYNALPQSLSEASSKILDLENVKAIFSVLQHYKDTHYMRVLTAFSGIYLFYQMFPLFLFWCPGTATVLSVLIGALYGFKRGILITVALATIGPALAYETFKFAGKPIILKIFRTQITQFQPMLQKHKSDMMIYVAVLRLTPLFPNFFINIASPALGVDFTSFIMGTFLGLVPNTAILVLMGTSLMELESLGSTVGVVLLLSLLGLLLLIPKIAPWLYAKLSPKSSS